jgi:hypothetical protein
MTHGEDREQSRNSPRYLLDAGLEAAGTSRYSLDPASNPDALVNARTEVWFGGELGAKPVAIPGMPGRLRGDGTVLDWRRYRDIFGNLPWNNLEPFFERAHRTAMWHRSVGTPRWTIQMLVPLRPHRVFWQWVYSANAWCLLRPVAFEGFEEKMAIPCVWIYWGSDVMRFRRTFHRTHGMVLTRIPAFAMLPSMPRDHKHAVDVEGLKNDHIAYQLLFRLAADLNVAALETHLRAVFAGKPVGDVLNFMDTFSEPHPLPMEAGEAWNFPRKEYSQCAAKITDAAAEILNTSVIGSAPRSSTAKKPAKRVGENGWDSPYAKGSAAKKRAKKPAAAKKAAKKAAAAKKPAKKAAKKTSARSSGGKRATSKPNAPYVIRNGVPAEVGDTVCRWDAAGKVGVIMGFDGKKCAKVRWGNDTKAVKVVLDDLCHTARVTKGTQAAKADLEQAPAANDAPAKLSKSERLDAAITTEILAGRTTEFSCKDVATAMSVSDATALRSIKRLIDAGRIEAVGSGRKSAYRSLVGEESTPVGQAVAE